MPVSLVEVREMGAAPGAEPIMWRLLTTHPVNDAAMAWQVVAWYRQRWIIEQFFRTLKQQGLQLEDSQLETADRLIKLTAIAARAACTIMQMVQARDGTSGQAASLASHPPKSRRCTPCCRNSKEKPPCKKTRIRQIPWPGAAWIIAKLGGWEGYPKSKPSGPITFRHGLEYFQSITYGWKLKNV